MQITSLVVQCSQFKLLTVLTYIHVTGIVVHSLYFGGEYPPCFSTPPVFQSCLEVKVIARIGLSLVI